MNKPTMYEFLHTYMHNLYEALVDKGYTVHDVTIECCCCPFKAACEAAAEAGCELGCAEYIKSQLIDGKDFE